VVRVWEVRSQEVQHQWRPPHPIATADVPIVGMAVIPRTSDHLLVVTRGGGAYAMTLRGSLLKTLAAPRVSAPGTSLGALGGLATPALSAAGAGAGASGGAKTVDFVAATVSPQGRYAYVACEDRSLRVFALGTGKEVAGIAAVAERDVLGLVHHPLRNLLASLSTDGLCRLWKGQAAFAGGSGGEGGEGEAVG
jgi:WD40 repeat-containing protein SMU1